jgi:hypothetical protein
MATRVLRRLGQGLSILSVTGATYVAHSAMYPAHAQEKPVDLKRSLANGAPPPLPPLPSRSRRHPINAQCAAPAPPLPRAPDARRSRECAPADAARAVVYEQEMTVSSSQAGALTEWLHASCADALKFPGFLGLKM